MLHALVYTISDDVSVTRTLKFLWHADHFCVDFCQFRIVAIIHNYFISDRKIYLQELDVDKIAKEMVR